MFLIQKQIIDASPFSRSTFFRRKEQLKIEIKSNGNFINLQEARNVAKKMGFPEEFEQYIKTLSNGKQ